MSNSIRREAERITVEVAKICGCNWESCTAVRDATTDAIDKALQARDERAAKTAQSEIDHAAQLLTERGDEGRDILNYTDFIKGQKTAAQDILAALRKGD